jgi:hypothetical protein
VPEDDQQEAPGAAAPDPDDATAVGAEPAGARPGRGDRVPEPSPSDDASAGESGSPQDPGEPTGEDSAEDPVTPPRQDDADAPAAHAYLTTKPQFTVEQRNAQTAPPGGERVTFRSVTLAEVYYARQADQLTERLRAIRWVGADERYAEQVVIARRDDTAYNSEFLLMPGPSPSPLASSYGVTDPPAGVDQIVGQVRVLGPSLVAVVLTFALGHDQAVRLDGALRAPVGDDPGAHSRAALRGVYAAKQEHVQRALDDVAGRCQDWLGRWAPGVLTGGDGRRVPACTLISLAEGQPFQADDDYLRLLGMHAGAGGAMRLARPDYMFLRDLGARKRRRDFAASFNEREAADSWPGVDAQPEFLHESLHPFMTVLALEGVLDWFGARMRGARSGLAELSVGDGQGAGVSALRDDLLGLSRDIAVACGDIKGAADDRTPASLWADYPLLQAADSGEPLSDSRDPGATARANLGEVIRDLRSQEAELRELVLVTSQAASDAQNARTAGSLRTLTIWLVVFTIALVALAAVTFAQSQTDHGGSGSGNASPSRSAEPAGTPQRAPIARSPAPPEGTRPPGTPPGPASP